jgi:CxxC motif-containing protein (DUF1111 family)
MLFSGHTFSQAPNFSSKAQDPGVRPGANAGGPINGLNSAEMQMFSNGRTTFQEVDDIAEGLGPQFNLDQCSGCHAFPDVGGSSPPKNPQIAVATRMGARNIIPTFLSIDGPVREVRLKQHADGTPDGGVTDLFTIAGRSDAPGCTITQTDFSKAPASNLTFRIPTPLFGAGLIEMISDSTLRNNLTGLPIVAAAKAAFGIAGRLNTNGNDGTVTRFGWKAQNKSLAVFSGEAYNVEQGVSNELFPNERDETPSCQFPPGIPNDHTDMTDGHIGDVLQFAIFSRFLAPPTPTPPPNASVPQLADGLAMFTVAGCPLCHTPALKTGLSSTAGLSNQTAALFSDLALHHMGSGLSDGVSQGLAGPDEFRTAPLWGLGQRIFFLHDGRTKDLVEAIHAHSSAGSEANKSISVYDSLNANQQQDLLFFLRSL